MFDVSVIENEVVTKGKFFVLSYATDDTFYHGNVKNVGRALQDLYFRDLVGQYLRENPEFSPGWPDYKHQGEFEKWLEFKRLVEWVDFEEIELGTRQESHWKRD